MKKYLRILSLFLLLLSLFTFVGCVENDEVIVDYASQLTLDFSSDTAKLTLTTSEIKSYIDGDTTHFYVPKDIVEDGVLKARYLAINTPESTGRVEPWGKEASNFTHDKLASAVSIVIESNDSKWNLDSTGGRYLVFVWYKTAEDEPYRNLNLEILQEGLAVGSSISSTRYADICNQALYQAIQTKIKVHSTDKAPSFYYGEAVQLTLKELRLHQEEYLNIKVIFEGVVITTANNTAYIQEYDEETDLNYAVQVYMGYNDYPFIVPGNRVRIVGTVQYYEEGGTYQISGLDYDAMRPNRVNSSALIQENVGVEPTLYSADDFNNKKIPIEVGDEVVEYNIKDLLLYSYVEMKDLVVNRIYTTTNEDSSSKGAMTLTCKVGVETITVRTGVLYDQEMKVVTEDYYEGKTIDVKAIVDTYDSQVQLKIFSISQTTIH